MGFVVASVTIEDARISSHRIQIEHGAFDFLAGPAARIGRILVAVYPFVVIDSAFGEVISVANRFALDFEVLVGEAFNLIEARDNGPGYAEDGRSLGRS